MNRRDHCAEVTFSASDNQTLKQHSQHGSAVSRSRPWATLASQL